MELPRFDPSLSSLRWRTCEEEPQPTLGGGYHGEGSHGIPNSLGRRTPQLSPNPQSPPGCHSRTIQLHCASGAGADGTLSPDLRHPLQATDGNPLQTSCRGWNPSEIMLRRYRRQQADHATNGQRQNSTPHNRQRNIMPQRASGSQRQAVSPHSDHADWIQAGDSEDGSALL